MLLKSSEESAYKFCGIDTEMTTKHKNMKQGQTNINKHY